MLDGMRKIVGAEGPQGLWRGVNVSLLISVPTIMLYLPLYDHLVKDLDTLGGYAPFVAGAVSRTASVVCTSPLEVSKRLGRGKARCSGCAGEGLHVGR